MKLRRVILEVWVPEQFDGKFVTSALGVGFGESCEDVENNFVAWFIDGMVVEVSNVDHWRALTKK